jgi:hypothetical protein
MLKQHRMKFAAGVLLSSVLYSIVYFPWLLLVTVGITYICSLPFSSLYFAQLSRFDKKPLSYSTLPVVPATVPPSVPATALSPRRAASPRRR